MDNVNYNFDIVETLIQASISCTSDEQRGHFYKPITLIMVSIIECILYDLFIRISSATWEGVPNIDQDDIDQIKDTDIPNKLASFIGICRKYKLLGKEEDSIYDEALCFANIRNRIHIQNAKDGSPRGENELWTDSLVKTCGRLLKDICLIIINRYPRPERFHSEYAIPRTISFPEPWLKLYCAQ